MRFLAVLLTLLCLAGCSSGDSTQESAKKEAAPSAGASRLDERAEIEKWNSYVDLGNSIDTSFYRAMNAYFDAFGNGSTYKSDASSEAIDRFAASLPAPLELSRAIDQAILMSGKEPKSDLDLAVEEITPHLKTLWGALIASRDHHAGRKHLLEGDTLAAELHTQIFDAYQGLAASYDRFRDILNQADAARRKTDLQAMVDKGLVIRPAMLKLLDDAQALQDFLSSHSVTSGTLASLDLEAFEPLYGEFTQSFKDYEKVTANPGQPKKEGLKPKVIEDFGVQAAQVKASADKLMERRRNNAPKVDDPQAVPGTPEQFAAVLGDLVDMYNFALNQ